MEIHGNSVLPLARYNVCTNARCICNGSYGKESLKMYTPCWCKNHTDQIGPPNHRVYCNSV